MWAQLSPWMVQDGQIPEVRPGQRLGEVGLRADCWNVGGSAGPEAIVAGQGPDPDGFLTAHYDVTATVEWTQEPCTLALSIDGVLLLAEPNAVRKVFSDLPAVWVDGRHAWVRPYGLEPYSPDFPLSPVGSKVRVQCTFSVMADHEWDGFGFPDLRSDWIVEGIKIQRRSRLNRDGITEGPHVGEVVELEIVDQVRYSIAESDDVHTSYLLDLTPVQRD